MRYTARVVFVLIFALVGLAGSIFLFYGGKYEPPSLPLPGDESVQVAPFPVQPFTDMPRKSSGTLVVDMTHFNNFSEQEFNILLSRVSARGFKVQLLGNVNEFMDSAQKRAQRENDLEVALRSANSYLVANPFYRFTDRERELVRNFMSRGGKLLLISDATRSSELNSLASDFGVIYEADYLYNVIEHETNFQNFFVRDFKPGNLTEGLKTVVFYQASSISPESLGLAFTDANTFSSAREMRGPFTTMTLSGNGRVLALSNLTFMIPPYNSVLDNDRLISNIADFLTTSERTFRLAEFPYFFRQGVDVVAANQQLIEGAQSFRGILSNYERISEVKNEESFLKDTAFVGLWRDFPGVEHYLSQAGIMIGQKIQTPFTSDIPAEGTALLYLDQTQGRNVLIVLGDSKDVVEGVIAMLGTGDFRQGLVSDSLGIYRSEVRASPAGPGRTPVPSARK